MFDEVLPVVMSCDGRAEGALADDVDDAFIVLASGMVPVLGIDEMLPLEDFRSDSEVETI